MILGKFKTNFKDEIATRIYKIIDATANAIIHDKVRIEHNYTPSQEGDKVGASWFNDVGKRLNNLEDGTEAVKKASNVNWTGVTNKPSEIDNWSKFLPLEAKKNIITNILHIDTTGNFTSPCMQAGIVATEDASKLLGSPVTSGAFYAYREVEVIELNSNNRKIIVKLTEAYPLAGRLWCVVYNTITKTWSNWICASDGGNAQTVNGFSFVNSAADGQPAYVPGFNGGSPTGMPMYTPRNWTVRSADNAVNSTMLDGWKVQRANMIINPAGNDYVSIPLISGRTSNDNAFPIIFNGNWAAQTLHVRGKSINGNNLLVHFERAVGNNIQLNILWIYK